MSPFTTRLLAMLAIVMVAGCTVDTYCIRCQSDDAGGDDGGNDQGTFDAPDRSTLPETGVCIPNENGEACNFADDDCDGSVDEGFDTSSDPLNCGACGTSCITANAVVACESSECVEQGCFEGFADLDPDNDGCEYRCPVFPEIAEACNGIDDDCDGIVDEAAALTPPANFCRTTAGTPCAAARPTCATREGVTTWYCDYPADVEFDPRTPNGIAAEETLCDGFDGDCDGVADDPFTDVGSPCDNGERGACRDEGVVVCDPADATMTVCDLSPAPNPVPGAPMDETCNGVDDNCDGIIDNSDPADPARVRDDMVRITAGGSSYWIYAYEATRPDAAAMDAGTQSTRACSRANALPWTTVGFDAANAACQAAGHRLCTSQEWQAACEGGAGQTYPYGGNYSANMCNGADYDSVPGGSVDHVLSVGGAFPMCEQNGVFDMSGNVKEWTNDRPNAAQQIYVIRGGSYDSPELGLTCQTRLSRARQDAALPTLGFRCCSSTGP